VHRRAAARRLRVPGNHEALKRALRAARNESGYESDIALALASDVHLQTIQNWMSGKTTPRPAELSKVARAVDKPMDHFMAIYEDREPQEQPLHEAVADLTATLKEGRDVDSLATAIERQADSLDTLASEIRISALAVLSSQAGTAELLGELVAAAHAGTLDELVLALRGGSPDSDGGSRGATG
jgi:transcriptional regulator with XRE-family HTH domain